MNFQKIIFSELLSKTQPINFLHFLLVITGVHWHLDILFKNAQHSVHTSNKFCYLLRLRQFVSISLYHAFEKSLTLSNSSHSYRAQSTLLFSRVDQALALIYHQPGKTKTLNSKLTVESTVPYRLWGKKISKCKKWSLLSHLVKALFLLKYEHCTKGEGLIRCSFSSRA